MNQTRIYNYSGRKDWAWPIPDRLIISLAHCTRGSAHLLH